MHWPMDGLVAWTLLWFGHGCDGESAGDEGDGAETLLLIRTLPNFLNSQALAAKNG